MKVEAGATNKSDSVLRLRWGERQGQLGSGPRGQAQALSRVLKAGAAAGTPGPGWVPGVVVTRPVFFCRWKPCGKGLSGDVGWRQGNLATHSHSRGPFWEAAQPRLISLCCLYALGRVDLGLHFRVSTLSECCFPLLPFLGGNGGHPTIFDLQVHRLPHLLLPWCTCFCGCSCEYWRFVEKCQ